MKNLLILAGTVFVLLIAIVGGIVSLKLNELEHRPAQLTSVPDPQVSPATVDRLLKLTNDERVKAGVQPLVLDSRLNKSAQIKVDDMATNDYYDHINPTTGVKGTDLIRENTGLNCKEGGENLLDKVQDVKTGFNAWLWSPSHKAAIISPKYDLVGFGINDGYVAQHFCDLN